MAFFPSLKQNFITYSKVLIAFLKFTSCDNHALMGGGYSNCCCSCSFEREIIKICQSSHKMYSNKEFSWVYNNLKCLYKKTLESYWMHPVIKPCKRTKKKLWNMLVTVISIVIGALRTIPKGLVKVGNWMTSRYHSNYNIVKIVQNTEIGPGDLRGIHWKPIS